MANAAAATAKPARIGPTAAPRRARRALSADHALSAPLSIAIRPISAPEAASRPHALRHFRDASPAATAAATLNRPASQLAAMLKRSVPAAAGRAAAASRPAAVPVVVVGGRSVAGPAPSAAPSPPSPLPSIARRLASLALASGAAAALLLSPPVGLAAPAPAETTRAGDNVGALSDAEVARKRKDGGFIRAFDGHVAILNRKTTAIIGILQRSA